MNRAPALTKMQTTFHVPGAHVRSDTVILSVRPCGIGILPMMHGLEGDPQRGIMRWGPQAHATQNARTRTVARLCAFWCLVLLSIPVTAQNAPDGLIASPEPDWPQWRGPCRDGISNEKGLLQNWPADGPPLAWKTEGLGTGWSSPIIVGERIYLAGDVGDDLVLFALDRNGKVQWRAKNGRAWKSPYPGARACCAWSEGRLYHLNAHGRLACLDAGSGQELWAMDVLERFGGRNITWAVSECLLVDGPRVIVTPGGTKALMAALDKHTGATIWTTEALGTDRTSHSSPILLRYGGRRLIANCSSAHGFGVEADTGKLLWTVPLNNPHGVNVATPIYGTGCLFYVTPYAEHGRLYLRYNGTLWCYDVKDK